jgi:hypothetical protein
VLRRWILTAGVPPPNDGCLFVDKPPPSISTLRDFVAAIAGLFLRRGFRPPTTVAYLSTNLRRLSLLSATSSPLSPVHSYGGGSAPQRRLLICRQTSAVYLYSPRLRRRFRRSILTALMRSSFFYFRFHHYERLLLIITRDYTSMLREITIQCYERLSILIIQPAVHIYRRFESTEDSFQSTHTLLPPSISTLRDFVAAFAGLFLRRLCDLPFFYFWFLHYERFQLIITRIPNHYYERFHFIVSRDFTSLLLRLHFIIMRFQLNVMRDYTSLLREIKYLNYTTRRLFLP